MPIRPPRVCACGYRIAYGERCHCERARARRTDRQRPTARQRGYSREWEVARAAFLALPENRYCVCGCGRRADTVDHHIPHRGDSALFWDKSNWRAYAFGCHASKAQRKDNAIKRGDGNLTVNAGVTSAARDRGWPETLRLGGRTAWGQPREIGTNTARNENGGQS